MKEEMAAQVAAFPEKYGRVPHLVVILVGEDPGSVSYVTGKAKAATEVGIRNTTLRYPDTITEAELLAIIDKLNAGEDIKIVSTGDSITDGWSASGKNGVKIPPYCPQYNVLVEHYIKKAYDVNVTQKNVGVSGSNTNGGLTKLDEICGENPDLVIIAFGMNDFTNPKFEENIRTIMGYIWEKNPECEIILISTMLPNTYAKGFFNGQDKQEAILEKIAKEYSSVVLAPVTSVHKELLNNIFYFDMTGNNINHPNDFLARIYAQTVLTALLGSDYNE